MAVGQLRSGLGARREEEGAAGWAQGPGWDTASAVLRVGVASLGVFELQKINISFGRKDLTLKFLECRCVTPTI